MTKLLKVGASMQGCELATHHDLSALGEAAADRRSLRKQPKATQKLVQKQAKVRLGMQGQCYDVLLGRVRLLLAITKSRCRVPSQTLCRLLVSSTEVSDALVRYGQEG
jgi:hypothetical protein